MVAFRAHDYRDRPFSFYKRADLKADLKADIDRHLGQIWPVCSNFTWSPEYQRYWFGVVPQPGTRERFAAIERAYTTAEAVVGVVNFAAIHKFGQVVFQDFDGRAPRAVLDQMQKQLHRDSDLSRRRSVPLRTASMYLEEEELGKVTNKSRYERGLFLAPLPTMVVAHTLGSGRVLSQMRRIAMTANLSDSPVAGLVLFDDGRPTLSPSGGRYDVYAGYRRPTAKTGADERPLAAKRFPADENHPIANFGSDEYHMERSILDGDQQLQHGAAHLAACALRHLNRIGVPTPDRPLTGNNTKIRIPNLTEPDSGTPGGLQHL